MKKLSDLPDKLSELNLQIGVFKAEELPVEFVDQLINKSLQPHILEFEGDEDAKGRFASREAYKKWTSSKKRIIYLLLDGGEVAGIIWFGERINPNIDSEYNITFGIRLYEGYVGKGLSKSFMISSHKDVEQYYPGQKIWLDFKSENVAARRAYESFGYKYIGEEGERVIMGYDPKV
ncbi:GNAT family N-acetyltransferase [Candidatus Saccharibacteria bacterium]|nr:GNAT family N-acetyltransferase [Candidatus Saccharibacteria bacterium]